MRTTIDLPEPHLKTLAEFSKAHGVSSADLIRQAVADFLQSHEWEPDDAFGLWKGRAVDGLDYERAIRAEWDR